MKIYVDMDGVIAEYVREDYIGKEPKFSRKDIHYFLNLKANHILISKIKELAKNNSIYILSSLQKSLPNYEEAYNDKMAFAKKHMPFVKGIIISSQKQDYAKDSILIDDYNNNLIKWEENGGIGIKYLNGINSETSWDGYKATDENIKELIKIIERRAVWYGIKWIKRNGWYEWSIG